MSFQSVEVDPFERFRQSLIGSNILTVLQEGLIGEDVLIPGPNGPQKILYADYVASGRALRQVETFVMEEILPYYANSHTEASFCGQKMTRMRAAARRVIARECGATEKHAVIFSGSGATAGLNRLVHLFGCDRALPGRKQPLVILGPYEHHSNILPWRESAAEVIMVGEDPAGGPDLNEVEYLLWAAAAEGRPVIGAFSAASNVTGIVSDVRRVTALLKRHGAKVIWDYAGGGPYLPIDMAEGTAHEIDAVVVSPHKFIGGPGASGVLILRRAAVTAQCPTFPGGGTVKFVSPWEHHYFDEIELKEEAGTPNVVGDLRAALAFTVKGAISNSVLGKRLDEHYLRAKTIWSGLPGLFVLGNPKAAKVLPIFSFLIHDGMGGWHHPNDVTVRLSQEYGVQARGGCSCAGPYGHRLLNVGQDQSNTARDLVLAGSTRDKPGWTRVGFSVLMSDDKANRLIDAVTDLTQRLTARA